jgi:hypothetical protein
MTDKNVLRLKLILAAIEATDDADDAKDAAQTLEVIRAILGSERQS